MIKHFDPYDKLIELEVRLGLLENYTKELQVAQIQTTNLLKDQNRIIKQLQVNESALDQALGELLFKNK